MAQNESTMKFKADVSQLKSAMQTAQRQVKLANAEFKAAASGMENWQKSTEGLNAKLKQLNKVEEQQRKQLEYLEKELALTAKEYGEDSKEADNLRIRIENQKAAINTTAKEIDKYTKELDDCGKESDQLGDEMQDVTKQTEKTSEGFTVMKGALANLVASGIKAAISGLKDLAKAAMEAYKEFDKGADAVIKATGATGDAAKELEKSYNTVAHNVIGDMEDIGAALGEVNTRFGWTGEELETATENFIKFADITGTDATEAVRLVSRAMENAGLDTKDYTKLLDMLAKAGQATGVDVATLAEQITKNGATLRQMGFSTQEAIAMLAKFEKEGVNTETVLAGMKKAVANWGKDGVNASARWNLLLDSLSKTDDVTEATQIAIEEFGNKAGPELVEDIMAGKLEYQDFLDVLKDSTGTVTDTYEATQDGFDKISLAIQGGKADLGAFVRDLATEYQDEIVEFIGKLRDWIKKAIRWVVSNGKEIIETIKSIAKVLATLWMVKKASQFANVLTGVITAIRGMATAASAASSATSALNGTAGILSSLVSPGGAIVLGIAAIATVTATVIALTKEEAREIKVLTDEQEKSIEKSHALKKSYDELETTRKTSMSAIQTEHDRYSDLVGELDSLVGANGRVKEGYETRVSYIIHELNEAYGTEMQMIDGVIQNYAKERQEINKLMEQKRAQAILEANESAYMEAYGKRVEATNAYVSAQNTFNEVLAETEAKQAEVNKIMEEYTQIESVAAAEDFIKAHAGVLAEYEKSKDALFQSRDALKDATEAYQGYNQVIENYEGLSAAIISGDSEKISEALTSVENGLKTHTQTTADQLKKQMDDTKKFYDDLIEQRNKGDKTISDDMIKNAKKLAEAAEKEYEQSGKDTIAGYMKGIKENEDQAIFLIKQLGYDSVADFNKAMGIKSPSKETEKSGKYFAEGFINGMASKESAIYSKAKELAQKAIQGLKDGQKEGSPSKITTQSGKYFTEGFINGISSLSKDLVLTVRNLVKSAVGAMDGSALFDAPAVDFGNIRSARAGVVSGGGVMGGGSVVTNNYNLVQNNTSPKALSALDTYRARQQQISLIKAVT